MFWIAAIALVVVHIALVMLLPWPMWKLSGPAFTPILFLDFFANFAVIRWVLLATNPRREASAS
jgi:hypothetical protein